MRRCVGEALAELEFKVALATILERWRVAPSDEAPLRPVRHGTLLAPPESFRVRLQPAAGRPTAAVRAAHGAAAGAA